jgi:hypothetical protein
VRVKNQSIKYDIFKINKGSDAENFSPIGVTMTFVVKELNYL